MLNMLRNAYKTVNTFAVHLYRHGISGTLRMHDSYRSLPEEIGECARQLVADSSGVEPEFLALGRQLQDTHQNVSYMIEHAVDSVAILGGDGNEGILNQIDRIVHDALTSLQICRDKVSHNVDHFQKGADLMDDLQGICDRIESLVLKLKMVGLNIGIESVRSPEAAELFGLTSSEIRKLTNKITEINESIRDTATDNRNLHHTAYQEICSDIKKMGEVAGHAETTVQEVTEEIKGLLSFSRDVMSTAGEHSRTISNQIGRVVQSIQFHDNMHQRITHISETLHEVVQEFPFFGSNIFASVNRKQEMGKLHAVVSLQTAQLKQVIEEVANAYSHTLQAFDIILSHVENMENKLSSVNSEQDRPMGNILKDCRRYGKNQTAADCADQTPNAEQLFLMLRDTIEKFENLLLQGEQVHQRMQDVFEKASESADNLSKSAAGVRDINFEIHLLSLNAIIKSTHIGAEGRALEILAHSVKGLSDQSNDFVARIGGLLEKIVAASHVEADSKNGIPKYIACRKESMIDTGDGIMKYYHSLNAVSMDAANRAKSIIESISTVRKRLVFLCDLEERLTTHLGTLERFEGLLRPLADNLSFAPGDEIEGLKDRYTMNQERLVHTRKSDSGQAVSIAGDALEPDESTGNIELFDTDIDTPCEADSIEAEDELGENVELF